MGTASMPRERTESDRTCGLLTTRPPLCSLTARIPPRRCSSAGRNRSCRYRARGSPLHGSVHAARQAPTIRASGQTAEKRAIEIGHECSKGACFRCCQGALPEQHIHELRGFLRARCASRWRHGCLRSWESYECDARLRRRQRPRTSATITAVPRLRTARSGGLNVDVVTWQAVLPRIRHCLLPGSHPGRLRGRGRLLCSVVQFVRRR